MRNSFIIFKNSSLCFTIKTHFKSDKIMKMYTHSMMTLQQDFNTGVILGSHVI